MRKLLLLRPEPGLTASTAQARSMGLQVIACPLFQVEPVAWNVPDPNAYGALLLTSANAVRHGGAGLEAIKALPAYAVGAATAAAARDAGFRVQQVGTGSLADLLAVVPESLRLLHLAGEHRTAGTYRIETRTAYRSVAVDHPALPPMAGLVAAVHSPRAARRLAEITPIRERTAIAAISTAAAEACGTGWERVEIAERPDDSSLLALAATLCHTSPPA